ncbi:MAG: hypothetical protein ACI9LN_001882 [Saprospiraceae bacterium]|jgi:hypothetical protein
MQIYANSKKIDSTENKESKVLTLPEESDVHLDLRTHPEKFPKFWAYVGVAVLILGIIFPDSYITYIMIIPSSILFYNLSFGRKGFLLLEKELKFKQQKNRAVTDHSVFALSRNRMLYTSS